MRCRATHGLAAVSLLALILGGCGDGGEKETFASSEFRSFDGEEFTAKLPGKPDRRTLPHMTDLGAQDIVIYTVQNADEAFSIGVIPVTPDSTSDLAEPVRAAAAGLNGTVHDEVSVRHQGFPAFDARISDAEKDGDEASLFIRTILVEEPHASRIYRLQFVSKDSDREAPPATYERFLASFKLEVQPGDVRGPHR